MFGEAGIDTISGGAGNDLLVGGDGNDILNGDAGSDIIWGGDEDIAEALFRLARGETMGDKFELPPLQDEIFKFAPAAPQPPLPPRIVPRAVRGLSLDGRTGDGNDTINGGVGNDFLFGGGDKDTIFGDRGQDYLDGGSDNDMVQGETTTTWRAAGSTTTWCTAMTASIRYTAMRGGTSCMAMPEYYQWQPVRPAALGRRWHRLSVCLCALPAGRGRNW